MRADPATSGGGIARLEATVEAQRGQIADLRAERDAARLEVASAMIEAAELRGRLAEATRPGPLGRLLDALTARLSGRRPG